MNRLPFFNEGYTRESRFSYECHACRRCCHDKIIRVNPYEVGRLAQNRRMSTTEFLSRYTTAHGTALKQTGQGACVFLTDEGCGVHQDRPLVCRLYPLGRRKTAAGEETFGELAPHPQTEGAYGTSGTVEDFLRKQGAHPFIDAVERYVDLVGVLAGTLDASIQNNDLQANAKHIVEHGNAPDTGQIHGWLDMDRVLGRFCSERNISVPEGVEAKMDLHIEVVKRWAGQSSNREEGHGTTRPE